ncbi:MAG TPA: hypothetical protein VK891_03450 [Euzebyales bacterium]|nr:hypothetical protein [Euzebyales bacterium]
MTRRRGTTRHDVARGRAGALITTFCVITGLYLVGPLLTVGLDDSSLTDISLGLLFSAFALVGVVIAARRPRNRIAWLCLAIGFVWGLESALISAVSYDAVRPGVVPRPGLLLAIAEPLWVLGVGLMGTFLLLLFPDGHLPSPRWQPLAWLSAITIVVWYCAFLFTPAQPLGPEPFPGLDNPLEVEGSVSIEWQVAPFYFGSIVASVSALLLRYRRSTGVERLQLKWLVTAGTIAITGLLALNVLLATDAIGSDQPGAWEVVIGVSYISIPIAIGVAVLRYRLYEIDRLISRTVSYAVIVSVLAATYVAGVFLIRSLLPAESDLAVATSTLAVAALFSPLRTRVQQEVDRRFNRLRYDAGLETQRFASRLRGQLDLDELTGDLHAVIEKTMQPSTASTWLRLDRR